MGSRTNVGTSPPGLRDGRNTFPGPAAGFYYPITLTVEDLANSEANIYTYLAPFDMRLMEASVCVDTITSDPQVRVRHAGTDVVASVDMPAADVATALTLVAAERNVPNQSEVEIRLLADSGDAATGIAVLLTYYCRGHVYADTADD